MLLSGTNLALDIQNTLIEKRKKVFNLKKVFVAVLFLGNDFSSTTYVRNKKIYGSKIGIPVEVFGQKEAINPDFSDLEMYKKQEYNSLNQVIELITFLNYDSRCVGIIVQLPLPEKFQKNKAEIISSISPIKDIDGMGGVLAGLNSIALINFLPATPKAVFVLLEKYGLDNIKGKKISILGQSDLVGKPLILNSINLGATIFTANEFTDINDIKNMTLNSDYIISCTGKIHLITSDFVRNDKSQILIDVGYGHINGKPVGDINIDVVKEKVHSYTPTPGGIGPLTIACLFDNIFDLQSYKETLKQNSY